MYARQERRPRLRARKVVWRTQSVLASRRASWAGRGVVSETVSVNATYEEVNNETLVSLCSNSRDGY